MDQGAFNQFYEKDIRGKPINKARAGVSRGAAAGYRSSALLVGRPPRKACTLTCLHPYPPCQRRSSTPSSTTPSARTRASCTCTGTAGLGWAGLCGARALATGCEGSVAGSVSAASAGRALQLRPACANRCPTHRMRASCFPPAAPRSPTTSSGLKRAPAAALAGCASRGTSLGGCACTWQSTPAWRPAGRRRPAWRRSAATCRRGTGGGRGAGPRAWGPPEGARFPCFALPSPACYTVCTPCIATHPASCSSPLAPAAYCCQLSSLAWLQLSLHRAGARAAACKHSGGPPGGGKSWGRGKGIRKVSSAGRGVTNTRGATLGPRAAQLASPPAPASTSGTRSAAGSVTCGSASPPPPPRPLLGPPPARWAS